MKISSNRKGYTMWGAGYAQVSVRALSLLNLSIAVGVVVFDIRATSSPFAAAASVMGTCVRLTVGFWAL